MSRIGSGRVRLRRSLFPLTSRFRASKRAPRNAVSSSPNDWIMVPMAPSSTRMRSAASARSSRSSSETGSTADMAGFLRRYIIPRHRPQTQKMAERKPQIGAVQRIEMKVGDAMIDQFEHLLGRYTGGDELSRPHVVIEARESLGEPPRHRGVGLFRETSGLLEILHRQNPRHDRRRDAAPARALDEAVISVVIEEELGDRPARAGIKLAREHVEIVVDRPTLRMLLGK